MNLDQLQRLKQRYSHSCQMAGGVVYTELQDLKTLIDEVETLQYGILKIIDHHGQCPNHDPCGYVVNTCIKILRL